MRQKRQREYGHKVTMDFKNRKKKIDKQQIHHITKTRWKTKSFSSH